MNKFYEEIMQLKEAEEFKSIIRRWHVLSENLRTKPMNAPVLLPDMLWIARSGVGKTDLLELMAEYLAAQKNLMEFYGDVKFFEFYLNYCSPSAQFTELRRLMDEIQNAAGFRSEFRGVVYVNISEWLDHFEEKHFVSFMEYLSTYSDKWLVVLGINPAKDEKIRKLKAFISMYLRIETVALTFPKTEDLFVFIEETLKEYGLSLQADGKKTLFDTIEKMRNSKYFDGYRTIIMLCQDIVYDFFSKDNVEDLSLNAEMLSKFSASSEYITNMIANYERISRIGFVDKE